MPESVIDVSALTKRFGAVAAVDAISFSVPRGATVALLGGNGAGKTTTISMLLGLLVPTAGTVAVLGHDMRRNRRGVLARMNFSSPYVDLPHRLTVRENLKVYGMLYGVADMKRRIDELAGDLHLRSFLDRPVGQLSAGQKTRVALAKALLNRPELLLLDEPTASPRSRHRRLGAQLSRSLPARRRVRRSCWPRTTWARSSACATRC